MLEWIKHGWLRKFPTADRKGLGASYAVLKFWTCKDKQFSGLLTFNLTAHSHQLHGAAPLKNQQLLCHAGNSLHFTELESSLSQVPATDLYPEPYEPSPHSHPSYFYKIHFNIILPSTSSYWSLSFRLCYQYPVCTPLSRKLLYLLQIIRQLYCSTVPGGAQFIFSPYKPILFL
jgi:hypothetical protein